MAFAYARAPRAMDAPTDKVTADLDAILDARGRGRLASLRCFAKLSGPGFLQSAITLGGGSLAASLYLGVLAGYSMMWVQPLAMVLGIVMLSAISYVVLATGERPFGAINRHVSPVLGWGWALASLAASMVWALPQFALATSVVQQNLLPGVLGDGGPLGETGGKLVICALVLVVTVAVTWSYDGSGRGVRLYERMLKGVVALIVLCFAGVVIRLSFAEDGLAWGEILAGFVPDFGSFSRPAATFAPALEACADSSRAFWSAEIVSMQRDVMISAAATAVGINMTFLLPYTLLARGWTKEFVGLARSDLAIGMLVPFLIATSCVVIAAASQFHNEPVPGLIAEESGAEQTVAPQRVQNYESLLEKALLHESGPDALAELGDEDVRSRLEEMPLAERRIAAMLVKRDAFDLAKSLQPLTGEVFANVLFGIGVLGMVMSTITLLMLISGFVFCEILGLPPGGRAHRLGTLAASTGVLGPFLPSEAFFYLAVPTSLFGMMLLPIAYWAFLFLMNSRRLLGDAMPSGGSRVTWNTLMVVAAGLATAASLWSIHSSRGAWGLAVFFVFLVLAIATRRR